MSAENLAEVTTHDGDVRPPSRRALQKMGAEDFAKNADKLKIFLDYDVGRAETANT